MTYSEQLKRGTKVGWAHADDDSMLAVVCQVLADRNALSPKAVYDWAVAQGHGYHRLRQHAQSREIPDGPLLDAFFSDEPLATRIEVQSE